MYFSVYPSATPGRRSRLLATAMAFGLAGFGTGAQADTLAGTVLQNQATAIYEDANTNRYTAQSNLSSISVRQVYSATLSRDRNATVSAGQTVSFSHTLTNTGNGPDVYTLAVADRGVTPFAAAPRLFIDANGNGQPDAGERELTNGDTVRLDAGAAMQLVIQGAVPGTALDGAELQAELSVTTTTTPVTDTGGNLDGADGTNQDIATVTSDAVLNIRKSSVHDAAAGQITYTVSVTNTGALAARNVALFDGLPAGTSLVAGSVQASGFGPGIDPDDTAMASVSALNEAQLTADLNGDGDQLDGGDESAAGLILDIDNDGSLTGSDLPGVFGVDAELPANASVSFSYAVSYVADTLGAGARIINAAHASADTDGVPGADSAVQSNRTADTVAQTFAVLAEDSDGFDGDSPRGDDVEVVATTGTGSVSVFQHQIRNMGNGVDTFNLSVNPGDFPVGTTFSFWDETNTTELLDTDGDGVPDAGPLAQDAIRTVSVQAQIPADAPTSSEPVFATLAATSSGSAAAGGIATDATQLRLDAVSGAGVDLANSSSDDDPAINRHAYIDDGAAITTEAALPGDVVPFTLTVQNDSAVPAAFDLAAGGSWDGVGLGALPTGWSVVFENASGERLSSTIAIPAGSHQVVTALVRVSDDARLALADRPATALGTAGTVVVDGNGDGDGDYAIFFRVYSQATGAADVKLDAVDVDARSEVAFAPSSTGQIQPGGSIDYPATLRNDGNTVETFTLGAVNSAAAAGWGASTLVDTDNDGVGDKPFNALVPGTDSVYYQAADGTRISQVVGTTDGSASITLAGGERLPVDVRVFAPSSAANGARDTLTLTASYAGGSASTSLVDQTTVVLGQLRLTKSNALDADCDGTPYGADSEQVFEAVDSGAGVAPGECVVWQVVVTNEGDAAVTGVVVYDAAPAFTRYEPDSARSCNGDAGLTVQGVCRDAGAGNFNSGDPGTAASFRFIDSGSSPNLAGHHQAVDAQGNVIFHVGADNARTVVDETPSNESGGAIASGGSVTVRFATRVE